MATPCGIEQNPTPVTSYDPTTRPSQIWAICGGKGGCGKTFFSASLGIVLAELAAEVTLIDADLGTPNLHTHLGVRSPSPSVGDFVYRRVAHLEDAVQPTQISRLRLVAGSKQDLFTANLKYAQKIRLLKEMQTLKGSHTLIDLGAGADFNTLDFLRASNLGIIIANPDPASVESAYDFLRAAVLRTLQFRIRTLDIDGELQDLAKARHGGTRSIRDFLDLVSLIDRDSGELLINELEDLNLCLVVNRSEGETADVVGRMMVQSVRKWLDIRLHFVGSIPFDPLVETALCDLKPYVPANPRSRTSYSLKLIAGRLLALTNGNPT